MIRIVMSANREHAARKIQRAVRRHLAKKYVMDHDGTMALNMITRQPIHRSVAIDIATPSGFIRTWDAVGLHDWFIKRNNQELRGFIHHLTPAQRARIQHLEQVARQLDHAKMELRKKKLVKGRDVYNNVVIHTLRVMEKAITFVNVLLVLFIILNFISMTQLYEQGSIDFIGILLHGTSTTAMYGLDSWQTRETRKHVMSSVKTLENRLGKLIDGIPLRHSNIRIAEYLDAISKRGDFSSLIEDPGMRSKLLRVVDKIHEIGL